MTDIVCCHCGGPHAASECTWDGLERELYDEIRKGLIRDFDKEIIWAIENLSS